MGHIFYVNKKLISVLNGISIVVIRWNGTTFTESKPCVHCCTMLKNLRIKKVYYSTNEGMKKVSVNK